VTMHKPQRIMIVEDEYLLADDLRGMLRSAGHTVVGPVPSEEEARELLGEGGIDAAVLDINLAGRMSYPLARELKGRSIPFVFLSGYDDVEEDSGLSGVELIRKPFTRETITAAVMRLTGSGTLL